MMLARMFCHCEPRRGEAISCLQLQPGLEKELPPRVPLSSPEFLLARELRGTQGNWRDSCYDISATVR